MAKNNGRRMLTTSGVAKLLNIHVNTVRRWSNNGVLASYRIGPRGDRRFLKDDVVRFLNHYDDYVYLDHSETRDVALKR